MLPGWKVVGATGIIIREGEPLGKIDGIDLVNWKSNTLSQRSKNLTTLSALYTIAETMLKDKNYSSKVLPDKDELKSAYQRVADFWRICLSRVEVFQQYLALTKEDRPVSRLREENLLMKPVTQMALAHAALFADRHGIEWEAVAEKLNQIDWRFDNTMWFNILVIGSANKKMITGKESIRSAGAVITYMVMGEYMNRTELADVREIIRNARNDGNAELPPRVM